MAQVDNSSVFPNMTLPEVSAVGKKSVEAFASMQKELFETVERCNREWVARLNEEAALTTDFVQKVTESRSIPEGMSAYWEWTTKQMELLTKQSQTIMENGHTFMNACTHLARLDRNGGVGT
jgi:hypothetical protein